ncbi:hypothetical protein LTR05_003407 [Lithohypha guttulata]|uniref:ASST-domain-containing protein n=1 Tax=Lithohypha guttulata TaxID=1690604 RepID=A0AAN7T5K2_9EURO|nr:hypothetical protein LTR05_003407 [Lithohypha guttulata]
MLLSLFSTYVSLHFFSIGIAQEDPTTDENLLQFKSRPDLYPPRLFVDTSQDGISPGYIFMSPYQSFQNSAAIYESDGTLIWYGFGVTGSGNVHDFRVCQYNNTNHLCFFQGEQYRGYARGQAVIMDTNLRTVRTVTALNSRSALDQHEFNIVDGTDSALTTTYHPERYDLSAFNITDGEGWIQNSIFQDVNLTTDELTFEWSAIEHVALTESYVDPNQSEVVGTGFNAASPWDYFHINSVDKNEDGDYLISARHVSTLYKISGTDGSIIWRCGGKLSDYELLNGLNWSYQHDARWLSSNDSMDVISFFDNASNGFNGSADHSSGYIIQLDHEAGTVDLLHAYPAPLDLPISASQGNLQILNETDWTNSNAFVGWGNSPTVTEHTSDGTIIYRANVASDGKMNYRAYKYDIALTPYDSPALYTYAPDTESNTVYYMSWNGATELRKWRVYGRADCETEWTLLDEIEKSGFETNYTSQGYQEFGRVEAVAADGTGLRNSTNRGVRAFVPSSAISDSCTGEGCTEAKAYSESPGQVVVAETRDGCPALPLELASTNAPSATSSAVKSGSVLLTGVSLGFASTCFIGLLL